MKILLGNPVRPDAVTTLVIPDEFTKDEIFYNVVGAMSLHLEDGQVPTWIDTEDEALKVRLEEHYQGVTNGTH